MKIVISSISRLICSYSKFLLSLIFISSLGTNAYSYEEPTYLTCNDRYFKLTGYYFESNYNIRTKKFNDSYKIRKYTSNEIVLEYGLKLDRNTGEYKSSNGKVYCILKKITFRELPKLNENGKLF